MPCYGFSVAFVVKPPDGEEAKWAWFAGVFEAQGSVVPRTRRPAGARFQLKSPHLDLVSRIHDLVGGRLFGPYRYEYKDGRARQPFWIWASDGLDAELLSARAWPWLSVSRRDRLASLGLAPEPGVGLMPRSPGADPARVPEMLLGFLAAKAQFGGDAEQPQVTVRVPAEEAATLRWIDRALPGGAVYGPYARGERAYVQWMARGSFLRARLIPLLRARRAELDPGALARFDAMCRRYRLTSRAYPQRN